MRAEAPIPADALAAIRAPFLAAGATLCDPAVIQPLSLLLDLAGEAMRARLFIVQDEGGREACLRPDFTAAIARDHIASGAVTGRYLYEGKAFRVAPVGAEADHPEEFLQLGLEALGGGAGPKADAAVAGLAWRAAIAGGRSDLTLALGDVALFVAFLDAIGVSGLTAAKLKRALARPRVLAAELDRARTAPAPSDDPLVSALLPLSPDKAETALEAAWAERGLEPVGGRTAAEIVTRLKIRAELARAPRLTDRQADAVRAYLAISGEPEAALASIARLTAGKTLTKALEDWSIRLDALANEGVDLSRATFAAGFGRAFGYYDGFLFEIASVALPADAAVAAGGRYDALPAQLGGSPGAVGCMVRPGRAWKGAA